MFGLLEAKQFAVKTIETNLTEIASVAFIVYLAVSYYDTNSISTTSPYCTASHDLDCFIKTVVDGVSQRNVAATM